MYEWTVVTTDLLWRNGLAILPLVAGVAIVSRCVPCRPATRHALWLTVLIWLLALPFMPPPPVPIGESLAGLVADDPASEIITGAPDKQIAVQETDEPGGDHRLTMTERISASSGTIERPTFRSLDGRKKYRSSTSRPPARRVTPTNPPTPRNPAANDDSMVSLPSPERWPPISVAETRVKPAEARNNRVRGRERGTRSAMSSPTMARRMRAARGESSSRPTPVLASGRRASVEVKPRLANAQAGQAVLDGEFTLPPESRPTTSTWKVWLAGIVGLRDAVRNLPPLPAGIWIMGTGLLLFVSVLRTARFRWRIRGTFPAPPEVTRMVGDAAQALGLRRAPQTQMIRQRTSPMIWCGLRPRIILPVQLWRQLDAPGRRAVICHELAHLRRRDHWVSWLDAFVGVLYWWHPIIWWVRRHLHAEAEVCCDAWVTAVLPRRRGDYARALLKTKQYLAQNHAAMPAMGIGVTTGRARRLARRLTMIMTQSANPKLSLSGMALVLSLAVAGWLANPAQSCPKNAAAKAADCAKATVARAAACATAKACQAACSVDCGACKIKCRVACASCSNCKSGGACAKCETCVAAAACCAQSAKAPSSFERHLAGKTGRVSVAPYVTVQPQGIPVHTIRVEPVAPLLRSFSPVLAVPAPGLPISQVSVPRPWIQTVGDSDEKRVNRIEDRLERLTQQLERLVDEFGTRRGPQVFTVPGPPEPRFFSGGGVFSYSVPDISEGEIISRSYSLPEGKLDAFTALMVRSDVPIIVSPGDDSIGIRATPGQHEVFKAFFQMIDPQGKHTDARFNFQFKGDKSRKAKAKGRSKARRSREQAAHQRDRALGEVLRAYKRILARAQRVRTDSDLKRTLSRSLRDDLGQLLDRARSLEAEADRSRERSERLQDEISSIDDALRSAALQQRLAAMEQNADTLDNLADLLENQADTMQNQAEAIGEEADNLNEQAQNLEQRASAISETIASLEVSDTQVDLATAAALMALTAGETAMLVSETEPDMLLFDTTPEAAPLAQTTLFKQATTIFQAAKNLMEQEADTEPQGENESE